MKIRYTYTVVRESEIFNDVGLKDHIDHIKDEAGEFLYGGSTSKESVTAKVEISKDGVIWEEV